MRTTHADVVVVGAGPAGSTAAAYLARAGRTVVLIEKETFPREKVCGDGLTPRAVRELRLLGLTDEADGTVEGWRRSRGLKVHGGRHVIELPWPDLDDFPSHSITCTRTLMDATLASHAKKEGAELWEAVDVTGPVWRTASQQRVAGVAYRAADGSVGEVRAPVVLAADGASSRLAVALGLHRRDDRPMAVAVRSYYETDVFADDPWLWSFLELTANGSGEAASPDRVLLPGYGWLFPMADGTVNLGAGLPDTAHGFRETNYRRLLTQWAATLPEALGVSEPTRVARLRSGPLPMGHARTPHHHLGVLLVGDAGGMVNPMNGEGIAYAMQAGRLAAEVADRALATRSTATLDQYPEAIAAAWGGYFTLGRLFLHLIGQPRIMRLCTERGLPIPWLMDFVMKTLANLTDRRPSDVYDVVINTLSRAAPAA